MMISRVRQIPSRPRQWAPEMVGVSIPWLARANGVSIRTIERQRAVRTEIYHNPIMTVELAIRMSQVRRYGGFMPIASRLAIATLAHEGKTYKELAEAFACSQSTIWRCVKQWPNSFDALSWKRRGAGPIN